MRRLGFMISGPFREGHGTIHDRTAVDWRETRAHITTRSKRLQPN